MRFSWLIFLSGVLILFNNSCKIQQHQPEVDHKLISNYLNSKIQSKYPAASKYKTLFAYEFFY